MRNKYKKKIETENVVMEKETVIVVTYFCCGKSFLSKQESEYSILDFDDYLINLSKDKLESDQSLKKRVEKYNALPIDRYYLDTLKKCIGKYDVILLSTKYRILEFLKRKNIPYVLVFPENTKECMDEWERRNKDRGSEWLWRENKNSWNSLLNLFSTDTNAIVHIELKSNEYLSEKITDIISKVRNK